MTADSRVDALQTALAAEHAAVWVYAALAGQADPVTDPRLRTDLTSAYAVHRGRRDALARAVVDAGATPVAAEPAYELPSPLGTATALTRAALHLERATAETYAWVVARTTGPDRRRAVEAVNDAAVRELVFRGTPEMLPGANEYADR